VGTLAAGLAYGQSEQQEQCFIYRDDIGAHWGIKGYEEQVTEVGTHHGHLSWPQFRAWGTYDSGSVRRGTPPLHFPPGKVFPLPSLMQVSRSSAKTVRTATQSWARNTTCSWTRCTSRLSCRRGWLSTSRSTLRITTTSNFITRSGTSETGSR
jgi:hypothetical protein